MIAPFVPEIFSQDFNFVIALIIGFLFGFILEQAGFSTSRKLVGLFYGYDFVVLRVFFTAGVTAMLGLLFMGNMGWVDISQIYIQPTFLYSAIIGGAIMGLGFIIGGYCPGTSIAGAAIGKIDAMFFVLGSAIGIMGFGVMYEDVYGIFTAENWGGFTFSEALGISPAVFAFLVTAIALLSFVLTKKVEDRVNKITSENKQSFIKDPQNRYVLVGMVFVLFSFAMIFQSNYSEKVSALAQNPNDLENMKAISPTDLLMRIVDGDKTLQIVDLRKGLDSTSIKFPAAKYLNREQLLGKEGRYYLSETEKQIVFIDNNQSLAREAAFATANNSPKQILYLKGGMNQLIKEMNNNPTVENPSYQDESKLATNDFKASALDKLKEMNNEYEARNKTVAVKKSKVMGGC